MILVLMFGCSSGGLPVLQFLDVTPQRLNGTRAVFTMDLNLKPILDAEGAHPEEIISITSYGITYFTAKGFKNLYYLVPGDSRQTGYKAVQLVRENSHPFAEVNLEWTKSDQFIIKWQDQDGTHKNTIGPDGKAR